MPYLFKALVLPLLVLTAAAMWISVLVREPWSGLFVNLAAAFIGTIITVFYIDAVLRRHESAQWASVSAKVEKLVERAANVAVSSVRTALGIGVEVVEFGATVPLNSKEWRHKMADVAEGLKPKLTGLRNLDAEEWKLFVRNLQAVYAWADRAISLFGARMHPAMMDGVLELQNTAEGMVVSYTTFPDIYGVTPERLQPTRDGSSTIPFQNGLYDFATQQVGELLSRSASLLRVLDSGVK